MVSDKRDNAEKRKEKDGESSQRRKDGRHKDDDSLVELSHLEEDEKKERPGWEDKAPEHGPRGADEKKGWDDDESSANSPTNKHG